MSRTTPTGTRPVKVAIVGGGPGCMAVMDIIFGEHLSQFPMALVGVADINPEAPAIMRAKAAHIFTTEDFRDLFSLPRLNLIIELTGNDDVLIQLEREKPGSVRLMDHTMARLFSDVIRLGDEKRRAEKRYKDLFDFAREGLALFNERGEITECNFSLAHLLGYPRPELDQKRVFELAVNESKKILRHHLADLKMLGFTTAEMDFVKKDGDVRPMEANIAWLPEERLFRMMLRDISASRKVEESRRAYSERLEEEVEKRTEKLRASEQEIRRRENFVQNLIHNSIDGIIATGEKGNITIFNQGAAAILGYDSSEIIERASYPDILSRETARAVREAFYGKRFGPPGKIINMELNLLNKSGESTPCRLSGTLLFEEGKEVGSVVFIQDLREIQLLQSERDQAERMAAVGMTVAGLAHYIKNIVTGLKGGAYVIGSALAKNDLDLIGKGWGMVERNIDQIAGIVTDMLTYSRKGKPSYGMVDPNELVRELVELMTEKARLSGVSIRHEEASAIPPVPMDRMAIHRCLLDLLSNAIDACALDGILKDEGVVSIETDQTAEGGVRFRVSDNGTGMDEETQKKLFTDFFTTKGYKGTGLGLPVTYKIVQDHGGSLTFESLAGRGTVFDLTLPGGSDSMPET